MTGDDKFFRRSPFKAYIAAVTASAFCLAFWPQNGGFNLIISGAITSGAVFNLVLVFILYWVLCFFSAVLPFILVILAGKKFKIKGPLFYAMCGAIVGGLLMVVLTNVLPYASKTFLETMKYLIPFLIAGLVAGITCWRVIRPR